ncbi:selenocysteine-specific translation elongation factor [Nitrospinota bacterium]
MKHIIIGTAGHIDHGKTSLVRALTGTDTDRLKEEKERGITIELGFAQLDMDGLRAGIVDVPGHERFVKNMLAGAGGIDLVVLVIAADEGVMPQTREHLAICRLLGVRTGLVALTKTDLVDHEWIELVTDDLADFVKGTFLEGRPVVPVSSQTEEGLDELREEIRKVAEESSPKSDQGIFRLPVDRVFTMRGFGAVVTGTLFSGSVRGGDRLQLYPGSLEARVRGLQVHGESVDEASAGMRTAVNLQGVERMEIERGFVLGRPGELKITYMLDVHLEHISDSPRAMKTRDRVRFHTGTSEVMGRVSLIGKNEIDPGESVFAQIRLEEPVAVLPRDRFVIRSYSPIVTIGGGEIMDVLPRKHRRLRASSLEHLKRLQTADEKERLRILLREAGPAGADITALTGRLTLTPDEIRAELGELSENGDIRIIEAETGLSLTLAHFDAIREAVTKFLGQYHKANPLRPGAPREEVRGKAGGAGERIFNAALSALTAAGSVVEEAAQLRLASHKVQVDADLAKVKKKLEDFFRSASFQPPFLKEVFSAAGIPQGPGNEALQVLVDEGTLVRLKDDLLYHRKAVDDARSRLEQYLSNQNDISASEFRDLLGITRKHAIPLLEYFDTARITLRVGDKRVMRTRPEGN